MSSRLFRYGLPIFAVEIYLIFTLIVFFAGPVKYFVESPFLFWGFILTYHLSLILGYFFGVLIKTPVTCSKKKTYARKDQVYWILVISAIIAFFIGHKNISMSDSLIPYDLINNFIIGFTDNQGVYAKKISQINEFSGNKLLNIFYLFLGYSRIVVISFMVYEWNNFGFLKKSFLFVVSFLPVISGISVGTNKPLFDFAFIFGMSFGIYILGNYYRSGAFQLKTRPFFVLLSAIAFLGAVIYFGFAMQSRGGSADYIVGTSPLGHILLSDDYYPVDRLSFAASTWVWLSSYLVQGYYGFSQALLRDFSWTYGVGNSPFLSRQVEWIFGVDLSTGTFPHKVSSVWDETAQWHSLYSQLASDLHFSGIAVFLFLFGFYFAWVWKSYCNSENIYAAYLLPLIGLFFIFTPANNQVFGFIESMSAFFFISIFWLRSQWLCYS